MERTIDGRYEVQKVLGGGARGTVYLAKQAVLGREVAIAVFRPTPEPVPFARELEILSELDHPNVARILDGGRTPEGETFLVMEVVKGEPLRAALSREPRMPTRHVCAILRDVAEGLAALHAAGLAHRALRAESVVVTDDGAAKIVDLGCAVATEDARQDVFQLALLAQDCLGRRRAIPAEITELLNDTLLRVDAVTPPTARAIADRLARAGRRSSPTPPPPKTRAPRRAGLVAAAALVLASIAVAAAVLAPLAWAPSAAAVALAGSAPTLSLAPRAAAPTATTNASPSAPTAPPGSARPSPSPASSARTATPTRVTPRPSPSSSSAYHDVWRREPARRR